MGSTPRIGKTSFGRITVAGVKYDHDIIIRLDGTVKKRKKKLSKAVYGTSHRVSLSEMEYVYEDGAECLVIGTGQTGLVELSEEAADYLRQKGCQVRLAPTPAAAELWNKTKGSVIGLFHTTC
ncbi:MAG: hypothetical protein JXQ27_06170 [Acidobacteria bacterium]|nr:hypothetical protein [Acidobacteriota bacterium]